MPPPPSKQQLELALEERDLQIPFSTIPAAPVELDLHLRAMTKIIYFVTNEEPRALAQIYARLLKHKERIFVFNQSFGLIKLTALFRDWQNRTHTDAKIGLQQALIQIYTDDASSARYFYIILDPELTLKDEMGQRRILNILHQQQANAGQSKCVIFVGPKVPIPQKLSRFIEVVHDPGLTDENYREKIGYTMGRIQDAIERVQAKHPERDTPSAAQPRRGIEKVFRGLTLFETEAAIQQSTTATQKDHLEPTRIDPKLIQAYRRRQIQQTSLVSVIDTSAYTLDDVGGLNRFKQWVESIKPCWTDEGQRFGLEPPKGVLSVGIWGCGKSFSAKCLGNAWRLPVVQLEMGRLRSSGVGESESNTYKALQTVEQLAPCILWIDEAEKSFSGGASSAQSDAGTTSRTIGIFSTWLEENKSDVCLALTANSLATLPVEFVNRIEERFFFGLPSEDERIEILKIHLRRVGQNTDLFQLRQLAVAAKDLVGREIKYAVKAALKSSFWASKSALDGDILKQELLTRPRIVRTMESEVQSVLDWVGFDPKTQEGVRAKLASESCVDMFPARSR